MRVAVRRLLPVVFVALAGCMTEPASRAVPAAPGAQEPPPMREAFDSIRLSRTPCFGRCPVYSVTVHADGRVEYHGERWVASMGNHGGEADPRELAALGAFLQARPLPPVADYRPGKPGCGTPVTTDLPGASITIEQAGKTRTLHHYPGCPGAPDWLAELATRIDRAAASGRWVSGPENAPVD